MNTTRKGQLLSKDPIPVEGGKVIILPLIHGRAEIWEMINRMPADVRDDGVPRVRRSQKAAAEAMVYLLQFLKSPDGLRQQNGGKKNREELSRLLLRAISIRAKLDLRVYCMPWLGAAFGGGGPGLLLPLH